MIGTVVAFDAKVENPRSYEFNLERRTGIIRDKVRMVNARSIHNVVDHYLIESEKKYYFIECNLVYCKQD
jgi:hypothetical protein